MEVPFLSADDDRFDVEPFAELEQFLLDVGVDDRVMVFEALLHDGVDQLRHCTVEMDGQRIAAQEGFGVECAFFRQRRCRTWRR